MSDTIQFFFNSYLVCPTLYIERFQVLCISNIIFAIINPSSLGFPEFYDDKRFSHEFLAYFIKKKSENGRNNNDIFGILSQEKMNQMIEGYCIDDNLKETVSKIRLLRHGCGQTNQLIKSI